MLHFNKQIKTELFNVQTLEVIYIQGCYRETSAEFWGGSCTPHLLLDFQP